MIFSQASKSKINLFNKVYGSDTIRRDLSTMGPDRIVASWRPFLNHFRSERQPYLLY